MKKSLSSIKLSFSAVSVTTATLSAGILDTLESFSFFFASRCFFASLISRLRCSRYFSLRDSRSKHAARADLQVPGKYKYTILSQISEIYIY